jgi:ABC-type multidrug transport system ATPase subunit
MHIKSFALKNVGPFNDVAFEFDDHVNVFVGPNNSGKSCALTCLAEVCVYPFGIPKKYFREKGNAQFEIQFADGKSKKISKHIGQLPIEMNIGVSGVESLNKYAKLLKDMGYTAFVPALRWGTEFRASGPTTSAQKRKIDEKNRERTTSYEEIAKRIPCNRPETFIKNVKLAKEIDLEFDKRRAIFDHNFSLAQDKAIVQAIIDLDYKSYRQNLPNIHKLIDKIPEIASDITEGYPIEFSGVGEDSVGLYPKFKTPDGVMPLNALSQGTQSILHWVAHLLIGLANYYDFPNEPENCHGILIVDEIDAHLHPSWQRRIIPTLNKHFKNLQIFCSTHSPLMLAGLKSGQIILLKRNPKGGVTYSKNTSDIIGWSGDEILRNILELQSPTDLATDDKLKRLESIREKEKLSNEEEKELVRLRNEIGHSLSLAPTELGSAGELIERFINEAGKKMRRSGKRSNK